MTDRKEKYIDEVEDEIKTALEDPRGIASHQKRLAFCLSLGIVGLLENYLKRKNILKHGVKINHRWFKKNKENVKRILENKLTSPLSVLENFDKILDVAYEIESKRNELAYGKNVSDRLLQELINKFLDVKKEVENEE